MTTTQELGQAVHATRIWQRADLLRRLAAHHAADQQWIDARPNVNH